MTIILARDAARLIPVGVWFRISDTLYLGWKYCAAHHHLNKFCKEGFIERKRTGRKVEYFYSVEGKAKCKEYCASIPPPGTTKNTRTKVTPKESLLDKYLRN